MDYTELLQEQCPPAIVEHVISTDMAAETAYPWPGQDFFGQDIAASCHVAALLYRSAKVDPPVAFVMGHSLSEEVFEYFDLVAEADRPVITEALRRLAEGPQLPQGYLSAVTRHAIDVREVLERHFPVRPAAELATPEAHGAAFAYLRYLTAMGDREAEADLVEALRLEPNPDWVSNSLNRLVSLKMPNRRRVLRAFVDDGRQSLSPLQTPGSVVANIARLHLGMAPYEGPISLLDNLGRPVNR